MKLNELNFYDIGNKLGLVGAVFGDDDQAYLLLFPDQSYPDKVKLLELTLDDWKKVVKQLDILEVEVLRKGKDGNLGKAILRKTQRLIEQRVSWAVFKRDGYKCRYCGKDDVPLTVDHLVLWENSGPSTEDNLLAADRKCNKTRGNLEYKDWLEHPYYRKVSQNLTEAERKANQDLLPTLAAIEKRVAERESR